ncbi:hypothetical protein BegalDRAFT_1308 [Beggiatoa alba B18LD]|uniref:GumN protein n=1 Tax=Beggiatoa alba B18LD TaxID=395493 RepID=I3CF11_9GAMM|nr:TraB/GumN family protein [Beggiatoa alba]EIJ42204.1 hypothetical protein BegalDRAFT_1308 [Beggiatoa alba B18LD]
MKAPATYYLINLLLLCQFFLVPTHTWAREAKTSAPTVTLEKGLLWKIEKEGIKTSYLLGTIHSEDPRVAKLSPTVRQAIDKSELAVFELELNFSTLYKSVTAMYLEGEQTLEQIIGKEDYPAMIQQLEKHGFPESVVKRMKPWAVMLTISMPKSKTGQILDLLLYQYALQLGKKIKGLETAEEQLSLFENIPLTEQITLLKDSLAHIESVNETLEQLHKFYIAHTLQAMKDFEAIYLEKTTNEPELVKALMVKLVDERNNRMVERIIPIIQQTSTFIAVGSMHLVGETGIIYQLRKQGYKVSAVW